MESPWPVAGLALAGSITFGATFVPGMALLTRAADSAGLDGVLAIALANFAWALGHAVGSPFCGWLADLAGDTATYLAFAALCLGALAAIWRRRPVAATRRP
jgi:predicted MFS family arabinose efflux permease